jgi:hypothetical protein
MVIISSPIFTRRVAIVQNNCPAWINRLQIKHLTWIRNSNLVDEQNPALPRPGKTIDQYCGSKDLPQVAKVINLTGGRGKIKINAAAALQQAVNGS